MDSALVIVIVTGVFQLTIWLLQKITDKKKTKNENLKTESETKNVDADTISKLSNSIDDLTKNYMELNDKFIETTIELRRVAFESDLSKTELVSLKSQMEVMKNENIELVKKNIFFERSLAVLQNENAEQKEGIRILIEQIKSVPLSPIWEPPANTSPR